MKSGYNTSLNEHQVKDEVNRFVFSLYKGYRSRRAVILPSVTCNDVAICNEFGIFTKATNFLAFEKGCMNKRNKSMSFQEYRVVLEDRMNEVFSVNRHLCQFCDVNWMDLRDYRLGLYPENADRYDFGNYDTCSYYLDIYKWFPSHIGAFKSGSPVIMTFDADYTGRIESQKKMPEELSDYSCNKGVLRKWFGYENILNSCTDERCISFLEDKCNGLANYVSKNGVDVDFIGCYREPGVHKKVMVILSGRKR